MFYIIGIDGRETPDPAYWYDRWECIQADSEGEAFQKYKEMYSMWLRDDEVKHVKIHDALDDWISPRRWIQINHKGE